MEKTRLIVCTFNYDTTLNTKRTHIFQDYSIAWSSEVGTTGKFSK